MRLFADGEIAASAGSLVESLGANVVITPSDAFSFDVVMILVDMLASVIFVEVCPSCVVMDLVNIPAIKVVDGCASFRLVVVAKFFTDVSLRVVVTAIVGSSSLEIFVILVSIPASVETLVVTVVMEYVDIPASTAVDACSGVKSVVTIKASADVSLDEGVTVIVDASSLEVSMTLVCISASLVVKV